MSMIRSVTAQEGSIGASPRLDDLPDELLLLIAQQVAGLQDRFNSLEQLSQVSQRWQGICGDRSVQEIKKQIICRNSAQVYQWLEQQPEQLLQASYLEGITNPLEIVATVFSYQRSCLEEELFPLQSREWQQEFAQWKGQQDDLPHYQQGQSLERRAIAAIQRNCGGMVLYGLAMSRREPRPAER